MGFSTPGRPCWSTADCLIKKLWCVAGFLTFVLLAAPEIQGAATGAGDAGNNPLLATYDGGKITLYELEEYAREMPVTQRIPFARGTEDWRRFMCGELAQSVTLTSQALKMGLHMNPGYQRARGYFIQEYLCYLVLRDQFTNRMDISPEKQQREYDTHKSDFWLSPTVTLRMIRTRDANQLTSAAAALKSGTDFREVEIEYSQVSPRYRGNVLGPFPSIEERTIIPPPDEVIDLAQGLNEGQTSGPLQVGSFHYLIKTEKKTDGRQQTPYEVAEQLEERLRQTEGAALLPSLIDQIQREMGVEVDEALFVATDTSPNDLLATVGAQKIYRREFNDLNGNVRGPAAPFAAMMPTKLKQFVLPYMMAEWAKVHDYMDRKETRKAVHYYDLQHLASKIAMDIADEIAPPPTDDELRARFEKNIAEFRQTGKPEPRFEEHREDMLNAIMQTRAPDAELQVRKLVLSRINFKTTDAPRSTNITALEALSAVGDQISSGARLLSIAPKNLPVRTDGATPYEEIGRAHEWIITFDTGDGTSRSEVVAKGPQTLLKSDDSFSSIPVFQGWFDLLRFDTDSLKRHAVDKGLGDFRAKHNDLVEVAAVVDFSYSKDDPTSPTDCLITYSSTPLASSTGEGFTIKYAGDDGEITKRRLGEVEGKSLTSAEAGTPSLQATDSTTTEPAPSKLPMRNGDL